MKIKAQVQQILICYIKRYLNNNLVAFGTFLKTGYRPSFKIIKIYLMILSYLLFKSHKYSFLIYKCKNARLY